MSFGLIALSLLTYKVSSQCKWQFGSNTLDLTPLQHTTITAHDDWDHTYFYSICANEAGSCSGGDPLMSRQVANSDPNLCYEIGRWNAALSPTYDSSTGNWQFDYQNGGNCNPSLVRSWAPTFICNPNVELEWGEVTELFGSCRYELTLQTRYACPNWTTTTISPENECIWKSDDGEYILNMTSIKGTLLSQADKNIPNLYYMYTPCVNSAKCADDTLAMTYIFDAMNFECKKYLAVWENGFVEPTYIDVGGGIWQFTYANGEYCNDGGNTIDTVFIVEWICDRLVTDSKIVGAGEIAPCVYQMMINSSLACG